MRSVIAHEWGRTVSVGWNTPDKKHHFSHRIFLQPQPRPPLLWLAMNLQRISFARTLPILALLLSYVILAVPATMIYANLRHVSQHGGGVRFHSHRYDFTIHRKDFLSSSILAPAETTSHSIQALNMPGFIIEAPIEASFDGPTTRLQAMMTFNQWRALILPLCCLPFWSFAGMGIDTLTNRHRRRWWFLLLGSILWVFIGVIETGLWFGIPTADRNGLTFPYLGLGLWFILFSAFPIAWVKQALARRRTKRILHARLSAVLQ